MKVNNQLSISLDRVLSSRYGVSHVRGAVASLADERAVPNGDFHAERALTYIEAVYVVPAVHSPFGFISLGAIVVTFRPPAPCI